MELLLMATITKRVHQTGLHYGECRERKRGMTAMRKDCREKGASQHRKRRKRDLDMPSHWSRAHRSRELSRGQERRTCGSAYATCKRRRVGRRPAGTRHEDTHGTSPHGDHYQACPPNGIALRRVSRKKTWYDSNAK
ncbi:uncharacterized protein LOC135394003 [Ornithodoros turicata]|uniref:uncharacterized protein LOC135394003 n=1 Tax=Ornithodoros turicata TaxID=34597 RepID=UPI003139F653